jgi:hypothetical protein
MAIAAKTFVMSKSVAGLETDLAAAIADGKQPSGGVFTDPDTGLLAHAVTTGEDGAALAVYATDGALSVTAGTKMLTKGSAGAYTLAAPAADNVEITIISGSAFAHVVTATALVQDGVTGGAKTTMTFAAFVGAAITLRSYGGYWNVVSKNAVPIT